MCFYLSSKKEIYSFEDEGLLELPYGACSHAVLRNAFLLVLCLYNPAFPTDTVLPVQVINCFQEKRKRGLVDKWKSASLGLLCIRWAISECCQASVITAFSDCSGESGQTSHLEATPPLPFLTAPVTWGSSWARDWTHGTAVTQDTAVTMLEF